MKPDGTESEPQASSSGRALRFCIIVTIVVSCLLWACAVALPVWETRSDHTGEWDTVPGVLPALLGFLGIFALCPAWFANLLLIPLFLMLARHRRAGFVVSLVALALAASAYILPGIYGDNDEAVIVGRRIGFYLWLGSFVILAVAFAVLTRTERKWIALRLVVVLLMVAGIASLEKFYPVGVSPVEAALKNPRDVAGLETALAGHPSQAEKDAGLGWAVQQNLAADPKTPSKQVIMLLDAGANPNESKNGDILLMKVLPPYGSEALVELLVKAGADVNARDDWSNTVLDIAIKEGSSAECLKFLTNSGARPATK